MPRRFVALVGKDLKLVARSHYLTVVVGLALLYAATINFLIPSSLGTQAELVLWDQTQGQAARQLLEAEVQESAAAQDEGGDSAGGSGNLIIVDSRSAFDEAVGAGSSRIGLTVEGGAVPEKVIITYQGYENAKVRRLFAATLRVEMAALRGESVPVFPMERLGSAAPPGAAGTAPEAARPPFNLSLLPIFILTEAVMVGLILAAALLYSEKEEGTLRAFRVSPGRAVEYLLAKSVAMGLLALVFTVIVTLLTVGASVDWGAVLGMVFLAAVVVTLIALVVANLFQTISQFLFTGLVLSLVLSLPASAYFFPSLSPAWFTWLPSYPLVFALREAYFPAAGSGVLVAAARQMLLTLAVALPAAIVAFKRQLSRGDA